MDPAVQQLLTSDEGAMLMTKLINIVIDAGFTNNQFPDGMLPQASPDVQNLMALQIQHFTNHFLPIISQIKMHGRVTTPAILPPVVKNSDPKMKLVDVHVVTDGTTDTTSWTSVLSNLRITYEYKTEASLSAPATAASATAVAAAFMATTPPVATAVPMATSVPPNTAQLSLASMLAAAVPSGPNPTPPPSSPLAPTMAAMLANAMSSNPVGPHMAPATMSALLAEKASQSGSSSSKTTTAKTGKTGKTIDKGDKAKALLRKMSRHSLQMVAEDCDVSNSGNKEILQKRIFDSL